MDKWSGVHELVAALDAGYWDCPPAVSTLLSRLMFKWPDADSTFLDSGGATALIAAVQPAAVNMSWRLVSEVVISSLLMLVWALIINVSKLSSQKELDISWLIVLSWNHHIAIQTERWTSALPLLLALRPSDVCA